MRLNTSATTAGIRRAEVQLRDSDLFLLVLALGAGGAAGLSVIVIDLLLAGLRWFAFAIPRGAHLSDIGLSPARVLLMPVLGGLLVGLASALLRSWRQREVVDAIEANALFGGRMSVGDSLGLVLLTLLSGGFCAFELIIGVYTLQTLAPVGIAALTGALVVRGLVGSNPIFVVGNEVTISASDYLAFFGVGVASAGLGIAVMKGVTSTEALFRRQAVPRWARPALGGLLIGTLALVFPQILGSGHGGILYALHSGFDLPVLAGLVVAKIVASAVSIGSGFRGGLFSTSLFLGSLFGSLTGAALARLGQDLAIDPLIYTLVGMGAVAAAIVGAPMTMIMIVLETTGDFTATIGVMVGVVTAAIVVRHWFGYSFATWRFHLRGLSIRSPEDVGWVNELLVGPMMRRDPPVIAAESPVDELRRRFPTGSVRQVFVLDGGGGLCGIIDPARVSEPASGDGGKTVQDIVPKPASFLLPGDDLRTALDRFSQAAEEALPVIDNPEDRRVIGYLSEAYALRRYAHELERRRGAQPDDAGIFSPISETPVGPTQRQK